MSGARSGFWRAKHLGARPAQRARGAAVRTRTAKREFWKLAGAQSESRGSGHGRNVNKDCIKAAAGEFPSQPFLTTNPGLVFSVVVFLVFFICI